MWKVKVGPKHEYRSRLDDVWDEVMAKLDDWTQGIMMLLDDEVAKWERDFMIAAVDELRDADNWVF